MKRYSEYKDSGVKWIGKIPSHWDITKLKYISEITRGAILRPVDNPNFYDENGHWTYLNIADVTSCDKYLDYASTKLSLLGSRKSARVEKGNLILTASATIGKPFINNIDVCIHDGFIAFKKIDININYLFYFLKNKIIFDNMGKSNTQKNIYLDEVKDVNITIPTIKEQEQIVKYLDKKTAQIETLIIKKEQLLETIKASRTKLISETVTKGLDKDVSMKDSGVEWIGQIPSHWQVNKIKYTTYVKGRIGWQGLRADEFIDNGPFLVTGTDFKNGKIDWNSCYHIEDKRYNEAKQIQLQENDLLITKDGTIGKIALVKNKPEKASLNSGIFVTRPLQNNLYTNDFMYWVLESSVFKKYIAINETGSTIKHLYQETFVNFDFMIPNKKEQEDIANYLNKKVNDMDVLISTIEEQIDILKNAKQKLITEVVTGKIDVTNL